MEKKMLADVTEKKNKTNFNTQTILIHFKGINTSSDILFTLEMRTFIFEKKLPANIKTDWDPLQCLHLDIPLL